jgi:hypothetical protein
MTEQFDVFLAHNSVNKHLVREIGARLRERGLNPWLDEEQIAPGELFQEAIQKAIPNIKSAAIIIGASGLEQWQVIEFHTLISPFIEKGIKVIPVLLPGVTGLPEKLLASPLFYVMIHAYRCMKSFHGNPFTVIFSRLVIAITHFPHS